MITLITRNPTLRLRKVNEVHTLLARELHEALGDRPPDDDQEW